MNLAQIAEKSFLCYAYPKKRDKEDSYAGTSEKRPYCPKIPSNQRQGQ
jgi:hypothetical protein